jgi:hypothetical protein
MAPLTVPKIFMAGGAVGFGYYLFMRQYWFPNPYKTQGVQNIEDRFSSGGGSPTHTPAGGTKRGTSGIFPDNAYPVVVRDWKANGCGYRQRDRQRRSTHWTE